MSSKHDDRALRWFLLLCFGSSWTIELTAIAAGVRLDRPGDPRGLVLAAGCMLLPAASAWSARKLARRAGAMTPDAGLRRGPVSAYVGVWLFVPLTLAAAYALSALFGIGRFDLVASAKSHTIHSSLSPAALLALTFVSAASINPLVTSLFTFGEEYGWTGFLLPTLLSRGLGPWSAAGVYGAIWGVWHWPLIWAGHNYPGRPLVGCAMMVPLAVALALSQTALRLRTGSVFVTSFAHALVNSWANALALVFVGTDPVLGGPTGLVGIAVLAAVGSALLATRAKA